VSHNEDCAVVESFTKSSLDQIVCFQINICCCFVENEDLCLANNCSSKAKQLFLANGKQIIAFSNISVKVLLERVNFLVHIDLLKN